MYHYISEDAISLNKAAALLRETVFINYRNLIETGAAVFEKIAILYSGAHNFGATMFNRPGTK
jgi:hypothetical protein